MLRAPTILVLSSCHQRSDHTIAKYSAVAQVTNYIIIVVVIVDVVVMVDFSSKPFLARAEIFSTFAMSPAFRRAVKVFLRQASTITMSITVTMTMIVPKTMAVIMTMTVNMNASNINDTHNNI